MPCKSYYERNETFYGQNDTQCHNKCHKSHTVAVSQEWSQFISWQLTRQSQNCCFYQKSYAFAGVSLAFHKRSLNYLSLLLMNLTLNDGFGARQWGQQQQALAGPEVGQYVYFSLTFSSSYYCGGEYLVFSSSRSIKTRKKYS